MIPGSQMTAGSLFSMIGRFGSFRKSVNWNLAGRARGQCVQGRFGIVTPLGTARYRYSVPRGHPLAPRNVSIFRALPSKTGHMATSYGNVWKIPYFYSGYGRGAQRMLVYHPASVTHWLSALPTALPALARRKKFTSFRFTPAGKRGKLKQIIHCSGGTS